MEPSFGHTLARGREEYVRERWDMNVRRSEQLIAAAVATQKIENANNCSHLPSRESHVRELLKLETDAIDEALAAGEVKAVKVGKGYEYELDNLSSRIVSSEVDRWRKLREIPIGGRPWYTGTRYQLKTNSSRAVRQFFGVGSPARCGVFSEATR